MNANPIGISFFYQKPTLEFNGHKWTRKLVLQNFEV
jgi:hypothetical protein